MIRVNRAELQKGHYTGRQTIPPYKLSMIFAQKVDKNGFPNSILIDHATQTLSNGEVGYESKQSNVNGDKATNECFSPTNITVLNK